MKLLYIVLVLLLLNCSTSKPRKEWVEKKHTYQLLDSTKIGNDLLIRHICKNPGCYRIDSFILIKEYKIYK